MVGPFTWPDAIAIALHRPGGTIRHDDSRTRAGTEGSCASVVCTCKPGWGHATVAVSNRFTVLRRSSPLQLIFHFPCISGTLRAPNSERISGVHCSTPSYKPLAHAEAHRQSAISDDHRLQILLPCSCRICHDRVGYSTSHHHDATKPGRKKLTSASRHAGLWTPWAGSSHHKWSGLCHSLSAP